MKKFLTLICIFLFFSLACFTQEKHALLVGISHYPAFPDRPLSSHRDISKIEQMLISQKFSEDNIQKLLEKEATVEGLHKAFSNLIHNISASDIVYFHFSGHGRRVVDIFEEDEQDRLDESLVMYDAQNQGTFDTLIRRRNQNKLEHIISDPKYTKGYFIDDQLNYYINRLREKLGKKGQIVVVLDCCHAGTGTRGIGESKLVHRGIDNPFVPEGYSRNSSFDSTWYAVDLNHEYTEGLASLTSFFGCKASETNKEYKLNDKPTYIGSLSYFFDKAIKELDSNATYRNLYAKIRQYNMKRTLGKNDGPQTVLFESDNKDALVFSGTLVKQEASYNLLDVSKKQAIIDGGMIHGFVIGDTIGFFSNTTTSIKGLEPIFRGVISEVDLDKSKVELLQVREGHEENDHGLYRAFQIGWALTPIKIKVQTKFTAQLSEKLKTELIEFIQSVQNVELVDYGPDIVVADTINNNETSIILKIGNGQIPLLKMSPIPINSENLKKDIRKKLLNEVKLKNFSLLDISDERIDISIDFDLNKTFKDGESIPLKMTNNTNRRLYFKILNISTTHELSFANPDGWNELEANGIIDSSMKVNCEKNECGKSQMIFVFSFSKIPGFENILQLGEINNDMRGDNSFYDFFEASTEGKTRSSNKRPPRIELRHFFLEMDPD